MERRKVEIIKDVELTIEQKYEIVIDRLYYAMSSYFKDMNDVNDTEVINTACDFIASYLEEKDKNKKYYCKVSDCIENANDICIYLQLKENILSEIECPLN